MDGHGERMTTAQRYRAFAAREARGHSPRYEALALAVGADKRVLALLDELPEQKRQPNLLFAAAQYLGAPVGVPADFLDWVARSWSPLSTTMMQRRTQTNEPARCATLLPVLTRLPQPLALLEVGASAGLCLYPDAFRYRYGDDPHFLGPASSPVRLTCAVSGHVPIPTAVPTVTWRAGLDVNPLRVDDDDDVRWLDALIWPEQRQRRERLQAAVQIARADPPHLVKGNLLTDLPALAAQAPGDATLVVFHSAVLSYVSPDTRSAFMDVVRRLRGHWISNEGVGVLPEVGAGIATDSAGPARFLLALDGEAVAFTGPHGQEIEWLALCGSAG